MRGIVLFLIFMTFVSLSAAEKSEESFFSISKTIPLHDEDRWFALLGYRTHFPASLDNQHALQTVSFGLGLSVLMDKKTSDNIETLMYDAIENEGSFRKLSGYKPYRTIGGIYTGKDSAAVIVVATMPTTVYQIVERPAECEKYERDHGIRSRDVLVGSFRGCWIEYPGSAETSSTLSWDAQGVTYMIFPLNKGKLTLEEARAYAAEVIQCSMEK